MKRVLNGGQRPFLHDDDVLGLPFVSIVVGFDVGSGDGVAEVHHDVIPRRHRDGIEAAMAQRVVGRFPTDVAHSPDDPGDDFDLRRRAVSSGAVPFKLGFVTKSLQFTVFFPWSYENECYE